MLTIESHSDAKISVHFPNGEGITITFGVPVDEPTRTHTLDLVKFLNTAAEAWEQAWRDGISTDKLR
jgi:hypothetical protein